MDESGSCENCTIKMLLGCSINGMQFWQNKTESACIYNCSTDLETHHTCILALNEDRKFVNTIIFRLV